uniref:Si:ch211-213a13.2 n=1 Tax=Cyprinus carpio carpio TaxID=630221 RepID=A0A8C1HA01_CYPCA
MSVSVEQKERSHSQVSSSECVKSDQLKGERLFNEETPIKSEKSGLNVSFSDETPSQAKSERSGSPVSSSMSMKSDHSKGDRLTFSEKTPSSSKSVRSGSHVSSSVSVKSDHSKGDGPDFSEKTPCHKSVRSGSHVSSSVSVKSDRSKGHGPNFSEKKTSPSKSVRSGSHVSSSVSVKSDHSKGDGPDFSEKTPCNKSERSDSHVSSFVSMESDHSKGDGPEFNEKTPSPSKSNKGQKTTVNIGAEITRWDALKAQKQLNSDVELASFLLNRVQFEKSDSNYKNYSNRKNFRENLLWIFKDLEKKIIVFLKNELEKFKKILNKENTQYFVQDFTEKMRDIKEAALDITLYFLRDMKQYEAADVLQDELVLIHQRPLKSNLKKKHQSVSEGIAKHGDSKLLKNIYTDLYMTLSFSKQVKNQNEAEQVQAADRRHESQEIPVECKHLFEAPEQDKEIRTVLTKGVAGIGKSVSVQKFIVDWADGKENEDITFIFPLAFREMNLKEKETQSMSSLIHQFFPEIKGLNLARNDKFKLLFILDGLDECRLPLNFEGNETCRDVTSQVSLDVLLTNLIKGNLLPSALIWITTRPAAAIKIPPECIDRVTEVQGFSDAQKEEYFRKRFTDGDLASEIIDHVKQSKSLFIMCYIPVFCWISATVLENILEEKGYNDLKNNQADDVSKTLQESNTEDTPKTLTQMYTHFLRFQILQSRRKYDGEYTPDVSWDKDAMLSLGKLAFFQLQRNNLLFYDTDLEDCGIDASKASVYSGMCTQIFKEERGIILGTTFCFVHLSIQEFIAALYAHLFLDINKKSVFDHHESTEQKNKNETMTNLLKTAVDKALESETGHLDLFLRFLLGLSLQTNRPLLRGLLTQQDGNDENYKEIVQYIKDKLEDKKMSPERSINLFYCLNELNDQTLVKEIQTQLNKGSLSSADLSPAQWSAVAFVLLTSEEEMEEFDLKKFKKSDECLFRLLEVLKISKRALLNDCDLTDESCSNLVKALRSDNNLTELNMSNNNLLDSGVKQFCIGLENITCKLEILKLSNCALTEESCSAFASVLSSDSISLKELDLSNNTLQDSGMKPLSDGLKENCKLEILRLSDCSITEEGYKALASALRSNPSHLIELDLRGNDPGQSGVKELNDLLQDPNCQLKALRFLGPAAEEAFQYVKGIVGENPLLLRELNLNERELGDTDMKRITDLLQDKHCKLNTLILSKCGLTEESCSALATVLRSNPSLKELDMSNNNLQDSGVKKLGLENTNCILEKLRLSNCSVTEEGYKALASALRSNPSHLIELDLTGNDPGQSGVKELNDLLQDPNFQLKTLRFLGPAADKACQYVNRVLGENLLLLRELNLSELKLEHHGLIKLAAVLQDKHCKLNTLIMNNNNITEEDCCLLTEALNSNPSNLTELNLSGTKLRNSGMKIFSTLFKNEQCRLKKLKFNSICITAEGCVALTSAFNSIPSNLIELDLSGNKIENSGVTKISTLLANSHCTLQILRLSDCSITEEGYKALASALRSNPSHLIELDLTGNDPGQSGVKELDDLLQYQNCKLKTLRFLGPAADEACQYVTGIVGKNPLLLRELNLSEHELGDTRVNQISALLQDKHCKLNTLMLNNNSITAEGCAALTSAFNSNPSNLIELDLSGNKLENPGIKKICHLVENKQCRLEKLNLSDCSITEEGYKALASALRSNPSHLIELDLRGNDPGQSGVKELSDLLQDPNCQLKTLRFLGPAAEEACQYVTGIVGKNPLLLRELNLSEHELGDTRVNQISALLQDKHCTLNTLTLSDCSITEEGYKALASALRSNPSHLIELDLTGNDPGPSGVKELNDLLQDEHYKLKTIRFLKSPAAQEACEYLTEVLDTSPLLLTELDLSDDKLGDLDGEKLSALLMDSHSKLETMKLNNCKLTEKSCSVLATVLSSKTILKEMNLNNSRLLDSGVKEICEGLKNPVCELKILKLSKCNLTDESCSAFASVLSSDSSSLKDLDLSNNNLQDPGVKLLSDGLKENCKLEKLCLSDCSITEEGYKALASALRSNPSHLIELDLTGNDPGQSGVKELSDLLQDPNCQLKTLRFLGPAAEEACQYVTGIVGKNPLLLRELNLSEHELGDTRVNQISALLQDKHCTLNTLTLNNNSITEKGFAALTSVFISNPSKLIELDLSGNKLGNSGIEKICILLKNPQCSLKKLKLSDCSITEEGYKTLTSSLKSNSNLIELDLTGNDPGKSGVQGLIDLLWGGYQKLKTLRLLKSPAAQETCEYLTKVLGKSPLLLTELDLSDDKLGDLDGEKLSALLMDSHSKVEKMKLNNCKLTEKSCSVLATVLSSKTILKELNLNNSRLLDSGVKQICEGLKKSKLKILKLSNCSITEEGYKALASALKSNSSLIELDLRGNDPGPSGVKELCDSQKGRLFSSKTLKTLRFLSPAAEEACQFVSGIVGKNPLLLRELNLSEHELGDTRVNQISALLQDKHCKLNTLILRKCGLTEESCSALATVLRSNPSLKELDMSNNNLQDSGIKKLQNGLENTNCSLQKLRLSDCSITEEGYKALASALRSNPSHLIELDLTGNDPGQSGVKELNDLLQDPNCQLKTLKFLGPAADEACRFVTGIVGKSPLLLRELNLSEHKLGDTRVNQISALLQDKHCTLNTLTLNNNNITEKGCAALTSAFNSNPSNLIELDLSGNKLGNSGMKKICSLLENTQFRLEKLKLSDCSITEEGYKALASALRSNPSHLIELDLTGNDPGQSGVKQLNDLLQDPNCQLKTLRFLGPAADEACQYVTGIVGKNPLLLRELNLSERELGDTNVKRLTALLRDKHCTLNTLMLNNNSITAESCAALTSAFNSNPSNLIELDLSRNKLQYSGIEKICHLLKNTQCKMGKLKLSDCSVTEEGYKALASALRSNPSHLIELDLTGNDPGQSGVKELNDLLQDPNCQLKTLRLLKNSAADEACQYVIKYLGKNPLLLRELNLSEHELGDTRVNQISALLQEKHCKLNTLILRKCGLTEESCSALATVLRSNSSLKELDMSNNNLQDSGVKKLQNGLENTNCTLEKLRLSDCSITEEGYKALASALRSNPSHLIELDLTGNDPGQSGVKQLNDLLQDPNCQLKTLRFLRSPAADEACQFVTGIMGKNLLLLRELNLSERELGDTRVNQISALLQDKHCTLDTLILRRCSITEKQCLILTSALKSNPSQLRELDLSGNKIENTGVKHVSETLKDERCKLERLRLRYCDMTDEGCSALTSALKLNPSHLRELDLSENKLGDYGFEKLSDLLKNPQCKLETLDLCKCSITEKQCVFLTSALKSNPSHLRELDLSGNELKHTGVNKLYDVLEDSCFKLERLRLRYCGIKADDCSALTSALKSNPSHLRELDLSGNELGDSGVKNLCDLLKNPQFKLEILHLCGCSITEKQCLILTSALCLKPTHLRELNLSQNKIENKGVNHLCDILKNSHCKLERLSLNDCGITDVSSLIQSLAETKALQFLKELDLSKNKIGDSKQQLSDVLRDSNCKLSLEKEQSLLSTGVNYIKGWLTRSKAQEDPV